jgi:hypothetical protein
MIGPLGNARRIAALGVGLGLLAACTTSQGALTYRKPGVVATDQRQDEQACLRSSSGPNDQGYLLLPFEIDGPAFRRCMEVRGYVLEPVAAPRPARP